MGSSPTAIIHKLNRFKQRHCVRCALMNKIQHNKNAHVQFFSFCFFRFIASLTRAVPYARHPGQGIFLVRKRVESLLLFAFIWLFFLIARSTSLDRLHRYFSIKSLGTNKRIFLFYFTVFARVYSQKLNQPRDWICAHFRWWQKNTSIWLFRPVKWTFPVQL